MASAFTIDTKSDTGGMQHASSAIKVHLECPLYDILSLLDVPQYGFGVLGAVSAFPIALFHSGSGISALPESLWAMFQERARV